MMLYDTNVGLIKESKGANIHLMKKGKSHYIATFIVFIAIVICSTPACAVERNDVEADSQPISCQTICNVNCCNWIPSDSSIQLDVLQTETILLVREESYAVILVRSIFHPPALV